MTTSLDLGRSAYADRRWCDALEQLSEADNQTQLTPADLLLLGTAAFLVGRDSEGVDAQTRAHEGFLAMGDLLAAGRVAVWIGIFLAANGQFATGGGWVARAQRLAAEAPAPNAIGGLALVPQALGTLYSGDPDGAMKLFQQVTSSGEQAGDREAIELGRLGQGQSLVERGEVTEGMTLLDEVMVAVTTGELGPIPSGIIYCAVIGICWIASDLARAQEWTSALEHWCDHQPDMVVFSGQCHMHRAALFSMHGRWADAVEASLQAEDRARRGDVNAVYGASYQRADVERLRGRFAQAEVFYNRALDTGWDPQPGLALLRLAQDDGEAALTLITRAVQNAPPGQKHNVLPAFVEVTLSLGDLDAARDAADELESITAADRMPMVRATVHQTLAMVLLAEGDASAAYERSRHALAVWNALDVPFEAARCRVIAARACLKLGDSSSARLEIDSARSAFESLGAMPALADLDALDPAKSVGVAGALTPREIEVLKLVAAGKTNRAIAEQLVLSDKTVARHVSNIFAKLAVSSRAAATAFAYERHIVR